MKAVRVDDIGVFPAHAGVILAGVEVGIAINRFPRTRGGDPNKGKVKHRNSSFSPHTRG